MKKVKFEKLESKYFYIFSLEITFVHVNYIWMYTRDVAITFYLGCCGLFESFIPKIMKNLYLIIISILVEH